MDLTAFQDLLKEHCRYKIGDYVAFFSDSINMPIEEHPREYSLMKAIPIVSATIDKINISLNGGVKITYEFKESYGSVEQEKILGIHESTILRPDGSRMTLSEIRELI